MTQLTPQTARAQGADEAAQRRGVTSLVTALAVVATGCAATGLLAGGGEGRRVVETTRGVQATLYGEGLYELDTWLVGAGARGQDAVILLVEVPVLLVVLRWYRVGHPVAPAALVGVLAFFTYAFVSLTFGNAQNRLFPAYVAGAALAGFALFRVAMRLDVEAVATSLPDRPAPRTLQVYLVAVAAALSLAWLPDMLAGALGADMAESIGPYTSQMTHALDLGVVVPVAMMAAVLVHRRAAGGTVLALVMLVVNVCIGVLLVGQGLAQLLDGVPLTTGELVAKMLTFAALTLVAGGLLARMADHERVAVAGGNVGQQRRNRKESLDPAADVPAGRRWLWR